MANSTDAADLGRKLCVLKFGSSVLEREDDYRTVAQEIYRHIREGEKIVAAVSALAGETDSLLGQADRVGGSAEPTFVARLVRIGELRSAALLGLALCRMGVRTSVLDPHEMGLTAEGEPLDSNLTGLDAATMNRTFSDHDVIVVPGFIASHEAHGTVTLGRGGSDLSAVFFAARLGSKRVRLLKDVDGVYADDPAVHPDAERYGFMDYDTAQSFSHGLIQPKAIEAARAEGITIEIAAIGHHEATLIGPYKPHKDVPLEFPKLKVALLGCGSVGEGVLSYLNQRPDLFEVGAVLVRNPDRTDREVSARYTASLDEALAGDPDLVVELLGGADGPAEIMRNALRTGSHVVTANKAALGAHFEALTGAARTAGVTLAYSAAVGGGAPVLETVRRVAAESGVQSVEGVTNGTVNYMLGRLAEGWSFDEALAKAQELGFAEADPSADVDGDDSAQKLSIIARLAFNQPVRWTDFHRDSLRGIDAESVARAAAEGKVVKQVARCRLLPDGSVTGSVRIEFLPADDHLAGARDEQNRFLIVDSAGKEHRVYGKGAGRWPTAAAVFADIMDLQRALAREPRQAQLRMTA